MNAIVKLQEQIDFLKTYKHCQIEDFCNKCMMYGYDFMSLVLLRFQILKLYLKVDCLGVGEYVSDKAIESKTREIIDRLDYLIKIKRGSVRPTQETVPEFHLKIEDAIGSGTNSNFYNLVLDNLMKDFKPTKLMGAKIPTAKRSRSETAIYSNLVKNMTAAMTIRVVDPALEIWLGDVYLIFLRNLITNTSGEFKIPPHFRLFYVFLNHDFTTTVEKVLFLTFFSPVLWQYKR